MPKTYTHFSPEERAIIHIRLTEEHSMRSRAILLGRSLSRVSRELARSDDDKRYNATTAAEQYRQRRRASVKPRKLREGETLFDRVRTLLECRQWSPEQISARLKREKPEDESWRVSHETLYSTSYAYPCNELKKLFVDQLRQHKPKRGTRRKTQSCAAIQVTEERTIHARPEEIEGRLTPGHWEGDLIVGAMNRSCVGTVVERQTGWVVLCKMNSKSAADARAGFERQLSKIDPFLRLSMT